MRAFTLIEFLLYVGILAMVLVLTGGFLWDIIFGNIKETSHQEVQQNSRFALTKITQEIKKATGINSPNPGFSSIALSLEMDNPSLNPTLFDLADGKLRIKQGAGDYYNLTSNQVIVSSLLFTNLSYSETPGTIRIEITLNHINPGNRAEYQALVKLKSTVSLVPGGAVAVSPSYVLQLHYRWRNDDGGE